MLCILKAATADSGVPQRLFEVVRCPAHARYLWERDSFRSRSPCADELIALDGEQVAHGTSSMPANAGCIEGWGEEGEGCGDEDQDSGHEEGFGGGRRVFGEWVCVARPSSSV